MGYRPDSSSVTNCSYIVLGLPFWWQDRLTCMEEAPSVWGVQGKNGIGDLRSLPIGEGLWCGRSRGWNTLEERRSNISPFLEPTHRGAVGPFLSSFGSPSFRLFTFGLFSYGTFYPQFPPLCNTISLIGSLLPYLNPNFCYTKYKVTISFTTLRL